MTYTEGKLHSSVCLLLDVTIAKPLVHILCGYHRAYDVLLYLTKALLANCEIQTLSSSNVTAHIFYFIKNVNNVVLSVWL